MDLIDIIIGAAIGLVIITAISVVDCSKNVESIETDAPAYTTTR